MAHSILIYFWLGEQQHNWVWICEFYEFSAKNDWMALFKNLVCFSASPDIWLSLQVKIVDDNEKTVPVGEQGQVLVKKYSILSEYKNSNPRKLQQLLTEDGFVKTGWVKL